MKTIVKFLKRRRACTCMQVCLGKKTAEAGIKGGSPGLAEILGMVRCNGLLLVVVGGATLQMPI